MNSPHPDQQTGDYGVRRSPYGAESRPSGEVTARSRPPVRYPFHLASTPGSAAPLGATFDGQGVNFAVFAPNAERLEVCLFAGPHEEVESRAVELKERTGHVWHGYLEGLAPGQLYGYRADGLFAPALGHRFNPHKLLFDPYARALGRPLRWSDELFGFPAEDGVPGEGGTGVRDTRDSAPYAPLSYILDGSFDWGGVAKPKTAWRDTIIYEAHVKGFTRLNPDVPEEIRGTYAGLACEPAIAYLKSLGVTAIELLPVHHHLDEYHLRRLGLRNYWGYNTLGFFAPEPSYAHDASPEGAVLEFKGMVKNLHAAGIEVLLDVVYNHTCEGNDRGLTLCWRGLANTAYYRLDPLNPARYMNFTGTGNSFDTRTPYALRMILDSLRYWSEEMQVDGFRFDLATTLGRESDDFDRGSGFFDAITQDPALSRTKLIAEPWDIGHGGYQVGNYPSGWSEWNGRYRDDARSFWRGDEGMITKFATRFAGSSDLYRQRNRNPSASINHVVSHDGFTLNDLVTYSRKHNLQNGEFNRDGDNHNFNANYGVEGPTTNAAILATRRRQRKNFFAMLLLSIGTPMICAGDEIGRTQHGNNNAYCQDNRISWLDWNLRPDEQELLEFVRRLTAFRKTQPALRRRTFFDGAPSDIAMLKDIAWYDTRGHELTMEQWAQPERRQIGVWIGPTADGGDPLFYLVNAADTRTEFHLPPGELGMQWRLIFDTARPLQDEQPVPALTYMIEDRASALMRLVKPEPEA